MATTTRSDSRYTDDFGIERAEADDPGVVDKVRDTTPWVDHLMRMQERFTKEGGNQYSAGITYFSVTAIFPLAMLSFSVIAMVIGNRPEVMTQIQDQIAGALPAEIAGAVMDLIESAIDSAGAVFSVGALTALWSGLGWMNNLRAGVSAMWQIDPTEGGSFIMKKLRDFVALIGLILAFFVAFGVTAIGSSGFTEQVLAWMGIDGFPGMGAVLFVVGLLVGLLANFLVMLWMIMVLPRTKVPRKSGIRGALIGAVVFEAIKQLSTVIFSSAVNNPAGAIFGPVIGLMIVLYLVWRVVLYVCAWTATTEESRHTSPVRAPNTAVIRVRADNRPEGPSGGALFGAGAAVAAVAAGAVALLRRK